MANLDDIPTQPEYVHWRKSVLDAVNPDTGQKIWTQGQFNQAIGPVVNGRTWRAINEEMRIFLASAPS